MIKKLGWLFIGIGIFVGANFVFGATLQGYQGGTGYATTTSGNVGNFLQVASTSPWLTYTFATASGGSITTSSPITQGYLPWWFSVSGGLNGTSSVFYSSSTGNVGIGTVLPTSLFDVSGALTALTVNATTSITSSKGTLTNVSSTRIDNSGGMTVGGAFTQSGGSVALASTSITGTLSASGIFSGNGITNSGNTTTSDLTVRNVTNTIAVFDSIGHIGTYAGATCSAGSMVTSISATGTTQCQTTSTVLAGYSTSTTQSLAGSYLGVSGNSLTVSSTLATSTWNFVIQNATTTNNTTNISEWTADQAGTITQFKCHDTVATTGVYFYLPTSDTTSTASSTILGTNYVCGMGGQTTSTSFAFPAGQAFVVAVSSTIGTPISTPVHITWTKQ